jgi:transcription factor STE12
MSMYPQQGAAMAPPQKPETFMLSNEAQQSLPQDAQVALQQVDNREYLILSRRHQGGRSRTLTLWNTVKYFLISAPVDWTPDSLIRRFLLPTGEYVSCVLW